MARPKKKEEKMEDSENTEEILEIIVNSDIPVSDTDCVVMNSMQKEIAEELELQHVLNSRRMEYPDLLEMVQALWLSKKGDDSEFKRVDAIINEVKAKYPKPEKKIKNEEGE